MKTILKAAFVPLLCAALAACDRPPPRPPVPLGPASEIALEHDVYVYAEIEARHVAAALNAAMEQGRGDRLVRIAEGVFIVPNRVLSVADD